MHSKTPLITVYITNYNYENYIRTAIESVLNQTLKDFELIIIDDGSSDGSQDIIEEFAGLEKVSIIYQKNRGLNITNNVALMASMGKYIVRLDADDFLEVSALELMSEALEKDPELGLIFPNYFIVDMEGNVISEIKRHDFSTEVNLLDQPAHGACTMIRTEFLKALGGYDESYSCQDGYELWVKFINKYRVTNINKSLFYYRRHNNNLTNNETKILGTRSQIKNAYVEKNKLELPKTTAVIPIRPNYDLVLEKFGNSTFLDHKINQILNAKNITHIIVTSSDKTIGEYVKSKYDDRVRFYTRPERIERINVSLFETMIFLNTKREANDSDSLLFCSISYPFSGSKIIDDAINTLAIFKADSLVSVRPEHNKFYRHTGDGMKTILHQDEFTKLEREALYKYTGGIILTNIQSAIKADRLVHGKVGHIVVEEKASLNVESPFEKELCNNLIATSVENPLSNFTHQG